MTIEWTDEAVQAAQDAFDSFDLENPQPSLQGRWRAAIDAAVMAQFQPNTASVTYQMAFQSGRKEALEEAAKVIQPDPNYSASMMTGEAAAAIRALIEPEVKK